MRESKKYMGTRRAGRAVLLADGVEVDLARSLRVSNHSPTGFEWGYGGSGPAQTALAMLLDYTGDERFAEMFHQHFKEYHTAKVNKSGWVLSSDKIEAFIVGIIAQHEATQQPLCGCLHFEFEHFDDELDKGCTYCKCPVVFKKEAEA